MIHHEKGKRDAGHEYGTVAFEGKFSEPFVFIPTPSSYEVIEQRTDVDPTVSTALNEMVGVFRGKNPPRSYFQLPRMGRACFTPLPYKRFLAAKGSLGRSPGSDSILKLQGERWRQLFGHGAGSLRVPVDEEVSFDAMYRFRDNGNEVEINEVYPEGYSNFSDLIHEYRLSRTVYEPLNIRSPLALALLRRRQDLPWSEEQEAKQYLNERFRTQLSLDKREVDIKEDYKPRLDLDSGLLFRLFRSAVRPQDFYDLAIAGNFEKLHAAESSVEGYPLSLLHNLAITSGKLIQNGIIHGQLYYDYQNITLAGELCDMDGTVIAPSVNPDLARRVTSALQHDDNQFGTQRIQKYQEMLHNIAPNSLSEAKSLIEQTYYLWDASLRCVDFSRRTTNAPGTVLSSAEIDELRRTFVTTMVNELGVKGREVAATACNEEVDITVDFRTPEEELPLLQKVLTKGLATIQGWTNPDKPFNHFTHKTTEADIAYIINDYKKFTQTILQALSSSH